MASIFSFGNKSVAVEQDGRPRLDLSGPVLTRAFETVVAVTEEQGGIERYVSALKLKTQLFRDFLMPKDGAPLETDQLKALAVFMPTVRRRFGDYLEGTTPFEQMRTAITMLLDGIADTSTTDSRIAEFRNAFPDDRKHRWVRDLAAEILHNADPERYPLMTRWVWDSSANTGVIREAWFGDNVDNIRLEVPDTYETFVVLREELSQFLSDNGVFRDVLQYVDVLSAQVYADYITTQGGTYLRADFSIPDDPMEHTRRLLGLDGIGPKGYPRIRDVANSPFAGATVELLD